jgi:hypothetical protein
MEQVTMTEPAEQTDVGAVEHEAGETLSLAERARAAVAAKLASDEAASRERAAQSVKSLAELLRAQLGITSGTVNVDFRVDGTRVRAVAVVDGLALVARDAYERDRALVLLRDCAICGREAEDAVEGLQQLGEALAHEPRCEGYYCPREPRPFTSEEAAQARAVARLALAADELGKAQAYEQQLEDERPLIKEQAILRLMTVTDPATAGTDKPKPYSATTAEAFVEHDELYTFHRKRQREAIVARQRAWAELRGRPDGGGARDGEGGCRMKPAYLRTLLLSPRSEAEAQLDTLELFWLRRAPVIARDANGTTWRAPKGSARAPRDRAAARRQGALIEMGQGTQVYRLATLSERRAHQEN